MILCCMWLRQHISVLVWHRLEASVIAVCLIFIRFRFWLRISFVCSRNVGFQDRHSTSAALVGGFNMEDRKSHCKVTGQALQRKIGNVDPLISDSKYINRDLWSGILDRYIFLKSTTVDIFGALWTHFYYFYFAINWTRFEV